MQNTVSKLGKIQREIFFFIIDYALYVQIVWSFVLKHKNEKIKCGEILERNAVSNV